MFRRRRPLLRAAAIGGGAYVAGKQAALRAAGQVQLEDEQNERLATLEQQRQMQGQSQGQPGGSAPATGGPAPSMLDQLKQLAALHRQGALTDSEFSAAKAKLLAS
jgi:putative oligomerization/nucleic acid binding protein